MSEAALIINVGPIEHTHGNGLSGTYIIPPKPSDKPFALLVIYDTLDIQDIGDSHAKHEQIEARPLAENIAGIGVDCRRREQGVLLCKAAPDVPKELIKAIKDEAVFLTNNRPEFRHVRKGSLVEAVTIYAPGQADKLRELSQEIVRQRDNFHEYCRTLVAKEEVALANQNMQGEFARLISQGDMMWARPMEQVNISDLHRQACRAMGQERPWSYTPQQLVDCPGCGGKLKENVITCSHCGAILDEPIEAYAKMTPKEKAVRLYPERYAEAPALTPSGGGQDEGRRNPRR